MARLNPSYVYTQKNPQGLLKGLAHVLYAS
jgi:hypothetical protein